MDVIGVERGRRDRRLDVHANGMTNASEEPNAGERLAGVLARALAQTRGTGETDEAICMHLSLLTQFGL